MVDAYLWADLLFKLLSSLVFAKIDYTNFRL